MTTSDHAIISVLLKYLKHCKNLSGVQILVSLAMSSFSIRPTLGLQDCKGCQKRTGCPKLSPLLYKSC